MGTGMLLAADKRIASGSVIVVLCLCLLACFAVIFLETVYFLRQWKKMDRILDSFQDSEEKDGGIHPPYPDTLETRESRIVSELQRILASARFKQKRAGEEKDQVMELKRRAG